MADITYFSGNGHKGSAPSLPSGRTGTVHCLMIPLSTDILLLPNAAVAEVSTYRQPRQLDAMPDWYLGQLDWRDYDIPVIAFEVLNGDVAGTPSTNRNSRIAILNTLNGNMRLPYIGLLTQGIPRLQVIQSKTLEANSAAANRHRLCVSEFVLVNGEPVTVPDLDAIEKQILELS